MKKITLLFLLVLIIGSCQTEPLIDDIQTNQNTDILDKKISKDFPETMSLEAYAELIQFFIENPNESNIIDIVPLNEIESYIKNREGIIQYYSYNKELQLFEAIDNFSGRVINYKNESNKLPSFVVCSLSTTGGLCNKTVRFYPFNFHFWWNITVTTTCNFYDGQTTTVNRLPGALLGAAAICGLHSL